MSFLENTYIPFIVKKVIKKKKPKTELEYIEFSQALYNQVKKKEQRLDVLKINN